MAFVTPLVPVLALCLVVTLGGCTSLAAISQCGRDRGAAFTQTLGFRRGKPPAPYALSELLRALDADALDALIGRWLAGRHTAGWAMVARDGKTVRGSRDGEAPGTHLLAADAPRRRPSSLNFGWTPRRTSTRRRCAYSAFCRR